MKTRRCTSLCKIAGFALLVTATVTASAQKIGPIISKSDEVGIVAGLVGAGAAIGIGVYIAVHHGHSLAGCTVSRPDGLELENHGDRQTYALDGDLASIKPGEQVRVSGKKKKAHDDGRPRFLVDRLTKDYGRCAAEPERPQVAKSN